ncbi:hypothetical protein EYC80_008853 [Monilinia laxa]|uniref:Uncharacterized protein n=1 Tax=Monilinia laxa TaxID=61186 RepID=A0A5N6K1P5_MONLA|nr:hypothetical protein EYC80_008853 [Monilinia laxa]
MHRNNNTVNSQNKTLISHTALSLLQILQNNILSPFIYKSKSIIQIMATNDIKSPNPNRMSTISTTSGTTDASATAELSLVVDELLNSLSNKFAGVSSEIFAKMDEMSRRLDNLEATLQSNMESKDGRGKCTVVEGGLLCTSEWDYDFEQMGVIEGYGTRYQDCLFKDDS